MHLLDEEEQTADGAVVRVDEELGEGGDLLPKAGALKQSVGQGGGGVETRWEPATPQKAWPTAPCKTWPTAPENAWPSTPNFKPGVSQPSSSKFVTNRHASNPHTIGVRAAPMESNDASRIGVRPQPSDEG